MLLDLDTIGIQFKSEEEKKIITSVIDLIKDKDFSLVTMSEIARKSGVDESMLYGIYGDRRGLFYSIVEPIIKKILVPKSISRLKTVIETESSNFRELVTRILDERFQFLMGQKDIARLLAQEFPFSHEIKEWVQIEYQRELWPLLESAIIRFQKSGELKPIPPKIILRATKSLGMGYIIPRIVFSTENQWDDEQELFYTIDILMNGISRSEDF